jgi:hypothetical protein
VAIRGDRIEAVGEVTGTATGEIDALGMVIAPGFIDVHAHDDAAVVRDPRVYFKIMQGVTTDVVGNCGRSGAGQRPVPGALPRTTDPGRSTCRGPPADYSARRQTHPPGVAATSARRRQLNVMSGRRDWASAEDTGRRG